MYLDLMDGGIVKKGAECKVCRLHKTLTSFSDAKLIANGFKTSPLENPLYVKKDWDNWQF